MGPESETEKLLVDASARGDADTNFFGDAVYDDGLHDEDGFYVEYAINVAEGQQGHNARLDSGHYSL